MTVETTWKNLIAGQTNAAGMLAGSNAAPVQVGCKSVHVVSNQPNPNGIRMIVAETA